METIEKKVYLETRLRNLKRRYVRTLQHPDLVEETIEIKKEIKNTENKLVNLDQK